MSIDSNRRLKDIVIFMERERARYTVNSTTSDTESNHAIALGVIAELITEVHRLRGVNIEQHLSYQAKIQQLQKPGDKP